MVVVELAAISGLTPFREPFPYQSLALDRHTLNRGLHIHRRGRVAIEYGAPVIFQLAQTETVSFCGARRRRSSRSTWARRSR